MLQSILCLLPCPPAASQTLLHLIRTLKLHPLTPPTWVLDCICKGIKFIAQLVTQWCWALGGSRAWGEALWCCSTDGRAVGVPQKGWEGGGGASWKCPQLVHAVSPALNSHSRCLGWLTVTPGWAHPYSWTSAAEIPVFVGAHICGSGDNWGGCGFLRCETVTVAELILRCADSSLPVIWLRHGLLSRGAGTLSDLLNFLLWRSPNTQREAAEISLILLNIHSTVICFHL